MRAFLTFLLVAALPPLMGVAEARDGAGTEPSRQVDAALRALSQPLATEREAAALELVSLLPGSRAQILKVIPTATPAVRAVLLDVLADDASDIAIRTLLDVLSEVDDAEAARVFLRITADGPTAARLLPLLTKDPAHFGTGSAARAKRVEQLRALLLRAEIEDKFISRKSPTGSTGYYRGQFDLLRYARKAALGVVLHIAQDKALPIQGIYRTGPYRFLRPRAIDFWELRSMAVNAVAELATPQDQEELAELEAYTAEIEERVEREFRTLRISRRRIDEAEYQERQEDFAIDVGRLGDLLTARYLVLKDGDSTDRMYDFVSRVVGRYQSSFRFSGSTARSIKATTYIRCGWYEQAVEVYTAVLRDYYSSKATAYYNIACAYASWSLDPELTPEEKSRKLRLSLDNLDFSVTAGWTDIGWMDEDGDLDPIRDTDRYKRIVRRIRVQLGMTGQDD